MGRHFPGHSIFDYVTCIKKSNLVAAANVSSVPRGLLIGRETMTLSAMAISVTTANGYGSAKLCDLPTAPNIIIIGAFVDVTCAQSGFTSNASTSLKLALGTAAASSSTLSGTMLNVVPQLTGVGAGTPGTVKGATTNTEKLLFVAAGAKSVFVNISDPVASGTATETLNGTIELSWLDLGAPS